jgi:hypothetical protein
MKDKGEVAYLLSFAAGKEFEATTDGPKNTDVLGTWRRSIPTAVRFFGPRRTHVSVIEILRHCREKPWRD